MEAFNKTVSGAGESSSGSVFACKCVSVCDATYPVTPSLPAWLCVNEPSGGLQ